MKILVIFPHIPWPLFSGAAVRTFNISKELSLLGQELFLFAGNSNEGLNEVQKVFKKVYLYERLNYGKWGSIIRSLFSLKPYPVQKLQSPDFSIKLKNILKEEKFDVIFVAFAALADLLPVELKKDSLVILDQHELEKLMYEDYFKNGNIFEKAFAFYNLVKIKSFYKKTFTKVGAISSVSNVEVKETEKYAPKETSIFCLPNGVSEEFFNDLPEKIENKNTIVFCANLAIKRNVEAIKWFVYEVFLEIKKEAPETKLHIVGSWPSSEVKKMSELDGVFVVGQVEDIRNYYRNGQVFVVPYRFGAGTKLKVFEAMASGIPIVSTTLGVRGIDAISGRHLLIADSRKDFAKAVLMLLNDEVLSLKIKKNALDLIKEKYLWSSIAKNLEQKIMYIISQKNEKPI